MPIDLDLAILDGERTGGRHMTGTMDFMAIDVLHGAEHTYRHDLESFFYVPLWMCARRAWERGFQCCTKDRPRRNIFLFPLTKDGELDPTTKPDPRKLYDPFINAFDDAIGSLETGS